MTTAGSLASGHQGRRASIVKVDVDVPPAAIDIAEGITDVLVIVMHEGAGIGQRWLPVPADRRLTPEVLLAATLPLADEIARRRARGLVTHALGRPPRTELGTSTCVIVCTKDRGPQLRNCLRALQALHRPVDLLVVDNGSKTSETADICRDLGVRCVREDKPGQTSARNRGLRETTAELVAFTDDDVIVAPDWLDDIEAPFDDPLVMIATGFIGPLELDHDSQVQFEAHGGFERHPDRVLYSASTTGALGGAASAGAGANMVIRRRLVDHIGGFDEAIGAGTPTRTADDKVYFYRALEAGFRIEYDPTRKVWHQHRADPVALRRILRDYGVGEAIWTTHMLRTRRETGVFALWKWWARHLLGDVRRHRRGGADAVDLDLTLNELRGWMDAPKALATIPRQLQAGGDLVATPGTRLEGPKQPVQAAVTSEPPAITVAIGTHQRRDRLAGALTALAQQTMPAERFEVQLVLDGCTDGSAEMARGLDLPYRLEITEQPQSGVASARNRGIDAASFPVVAFLDDDIEVEPGWLEALAAAHARADERTWIFGNHPPTGGDDLPGRRTREWWLDHLRRKADPGHQWTMLDMVDGNSSVPLTWLRELGGYDESFRARRQDYELGWRHLAAGGGCAFCADARAVHHSTLTTESILKAAELEAIDDVRLVVTHPGSRFQLPMGSEWIMTPPPGRAGVLAKIPIGTGISMLHRLEQAGRDAAWRQLISVLWGAQYRRGVARGLAELGLEALPPAPPRRRIDVALDGAPITLPPMLHDVDLVFHGGGRALASIPAIEPSSQWSWDDIAERGAIAIGSAQAALSPLPIVHPGPGSA